MSYTVFFMMEFAQFSYSLVSIVIGGMCIFLVVFECEDLAVFNNVDNDILDLELDIMLIVFSS